MHLKINSRKLIYAILMGFNIVSFIFPIGDEIINIILVISLFILGCISISVKRGIRKQKIFLWIIVLVFFLISKYITGYSQFYMIEQFAIIISLGILLENEFENREIVRNVFLSSLFYWVLFAIVVMQLIDFHVAGGEIFVYSILGDKNYSGILVFMLFLLANKKKEVCGIILGIFYLIFITDSRSYISVMILFYIFKLLTPKIKPFLKKQYMNVGYLLIFFTLATIALSFFWVFVISAASYSDYKTSLNDISNRMRFVGNIYGLSLFRDVKLLISGFGYELTNALGLDVTTYSQRPHYLGIRIVQPHNSVLNLFLRMGIIPGILYFKLISDLIGRYLDFDNYPYVLPILLNSMFMHSLLNGRWLLFFLLVVLIPEDKNKKIRIPKLKLRVTSKGENNE